MLEQIEWGVQSRVITRKGDLPVTTLFFWKCCFGLRTSLKELIWCTNYSNDHIHTCAGVSVEGVSSLRVSLKQYFGTFLGNFGHTSQVALFLDLNKSCSRKTPCLNDLCCTFDLVGASQYWQITNKSYVSQFSYLLYF